MVEYQRSADKPALRRRAANPGDRSRADVESAPVDPGRGNGRPGAADSAGNLETAGTAVTVRAHHFTDRQEHR